MKYTIGEFAKILGVTTDTLRVYEKEGIVSPRKDVLNSYRYYTDLDCRNILMSRWYRSFDLPLKKASRLTVDSDLDEIRESIREKQRDLKREVEVGLRLLARLEEISREIDGLERALDRCTEVDMPGIYRIRQTRGNALLVDRDLKETVERWMDLLPYTLFSLQISRDELERGEGELEHNWGLAIREEDFNFFRLERTEGIEYLPPRRGLSLVILMEDGELLTRDKLKPLLDSLENLSPGDSGDFQGKLILTERESPGKYRAYIQVMLPLS